jgi:O-antigen/teichoic acid export membrane protein
LLRKILITIRENDIKKIVTAVFSQGMLSIANLMVGIAMAKYASKSEYGLYVFFFSVIGIMGGYHNAIISAPLMVIVNSKKRSDRERYIKSVAMGRNYFFIPFLLVLSLLFILYSSLSNSQSHFALESVLMFIVVMLFVSKEFLRTLFFVELTTTSVFFMDTLLVITVGVGMFVLIANDMVNSFTGLSILAAGYLSSYLFGKAKYKYTASKDLSISAALKENWLHAKWIILGVSASLFQNRSYIYVVSAIMGLSSLADVSASRLFLMPIALLNLSSSKIIVAKGSLMVANNEDSKFRRFLFAFMLSLLGIWFLYFGTVLLISDSLIGFLGEKYNNTKGLIVLWGAYFFIYTMRFILGTGIVVYKRFKKQAKYDIIGSVLTIVSSVVFVFLMGRSGAIYSLMMGEGIVMLLYFRLFLGHQRDLVTPAKVVEVVGYIPDAP